MFDNESTLLSFLLNFLCFSLIAMALRRVPKPLRSPSACHTSARSDDKLSCTVIGVSSSSVRSLTKLNNASTSAGCQEPFLISNGDCGSLKPSLLTLLSLRPKNLRGVKRRFHLLILKSVCMGSSAVAVASYSKKTVFFPHNP